MSDAKKCDVCGKFYIRDKNTIIRYKGKPIECIHLAESYSAKVISLDLCNECVEKLLKVVNREPDPELPVIREDVLYKYSVMFDRIQMDDLGEFLNILEDVMTIDEKREMLSRYEKDSIYGVDRSGQVYRKRIDGDVND
ncbi:hypothetical protein DW790_05725 [Firmicutes bacterium AM31-12AC]|nr:hypothetical protein DW790_05725 [Firmicutes bacterium AM31-12AC]